MHFIWTKCIPISILAQYLCELLFEGKNKRAEQNSKKNKGKNKRSVAEASTTVSPSGDPSADSGDSGETADEPPAAKRARMEAR
jgi:hypothetical protein